MDNPIPSERLDRDPVPSPANHSYPKSKDSIDNLSKDAALPKRHSKTHRSVAKIKDILHIHKGRPDPEDNGTLPTLADSEPVVEDRPASNRLDHDGPQPQSKKSKVNDFVHNPIDTTKSVVQGEMSEKITANMVATEITHEHDVRLIEAEDTVREAKTSKDERLATGRLYELVRARQDEFVHWTLDRHLTRVKVMSKGTIPYCRREEFQFTDRQGQPRMDWASWFTHLAQRYAQRYASRYVGYGSFPAPASERVITASVERILVASNPLQHAIMRIRRIYRWETPAETLFCLLCFLLLWAENLLLPGTMLGMILLVIRRGSQDPSIEDLRQEIQRIESASSRSDSFTDFVQKRGSSNWLEPLVDAVGPWLLLQLGDVANSLEVVRNFYEWRSPKQTRISLGILAIVLVITSLTPTWLLVKCSTLGMGFMFFALFPISSLYPEYRLLVSPRTWLLWAIPTHAEWAISTIRDQAVQELRIKSQESPVTELGRYPCMKGKHKGHLILSPIGIRFESLVRSAELWELPYTSLLRLEKVTRVARIGSGQDIKFSRDDGTDFVAENVSTRDKAFNQLIGYTGIEFLVEW